MTYTKLNAVFFLLLVPAFIREIYARILFKNLSGKYRLEEQGVAWK
jgi:hypothetical protein